MPFADTPEDVRHALRRLTFGETPGQMESVRAQGLRAWLEAQLAPASGEDPARVAVRAAYPLAFAAPLEARFGTQDESTESMADPSASEMPAPTPESRRQDVIRDAQMAMLLRQATTERQVEEVLVEFWANHFHVGIQKGPCAFLTADYVEHAIRPHVFGRFEEMLLAVAHHPAMLVYLDNATSSTPRATAQGVRGGLNENYGRELLELHTLGVDGGYTQDDVREAARVLTGWGEADLGFTFRAAWHDAGEKRVLGHLFPAGGGEDEGVALLRMLAAHPSTARFLARKLLQRFVTDAPSDAQIERLARVFRESGGDLREVTRALLFGPDFWAAENRGQKVRSGLEFFLAALRGTGSTLEGPEALRALRRLGEAPFATLVPTGYPETADRWADPGRLSTRWSIAYQLANDNLPGVRTVLPGGLSPDALARWLAAPEFQRQ